MKTVILIFALLTVGVVVWCLRPKSAEVRMHGVQESLDHEVSLPLKPDERTAHVLPEVSLDLDFATAADIQSLKLSKPQVPLLETGDYLSAEDYDAQAAAYKEANAGQLRLAAVNDAHVEVSLVEHSLNTETTSKFDKATASIIDLEAVAPAYIHQQQFKPETSDEILHSDH